METQLILTNCRGCEKPFYVHPEQYTDLCHSCKCFKNYMETVMTLKSWEKPRKSDFIGAARSTFCIGAVVIVLIYFVFIR